MRKMKVTVAKTAGFCFGVRRAVDLAYREAEGENRVFTLGPIIHNETVVEDLKRRGVLAAESFEEIPDGDQTTVIIRSHGVGKEAYDRLAEKGDYMLTDSEVRDILAMDREYDKFMLVINTGGPVDLTPVLGVGNILVLSQLGVETGAVLADILLGNSYPSGKLATTWADAGSIRGGGIFAYSAKMKADPCLLEYVRRNKRDGYRSIYQKSV